MNLNQIPLTSTWGEAQKAIQDNFTTLKNQFSSLPLVAVINTDRPDNNNDCSIRLVDVHSIDTNRDFPVGIFLNEGNNYIIMALSDLDYINLFESNKNIHPSQLMHEVITTFDGLTRTTQGLDITKGQAYECLNYSINKLVDISGVNTTTPDNLIKLRNGVARDLGRWWIPSVGELFLIFKNYDAINAVLTELNNKAYKAATLQCNLLQTNKLYWTSVPVSESGMWRIMKLSRGLLIGGATITTTGGLVRPVTNLNFKD